MWWRVWQPRSASPAPSHSCRPVRPCCPTPYAIWLAEHPRLELKDCALSMHAVAAAWELYLHHLPRSESPHPAKQEADAEWEKAAALTKKAQELSREAQVLPQPPCLHSL